MQKPAKEGWGLFCLLVFAQLDPDCWNLTLSPPPFFKPGQKGLSPLSSIRNLREGLGVAPSYEKGVGMRPEGEILLP